MVDIFLLVLILVLAFICCACFLAYKRKIERVEATVQTLQEREEMRTLKPLLLASASLLVQALQEREEMRTIPHDSSISLKWGRKSVHTTTPQQINTDALVQVMQSRLSATQAVKLVQVLETDPEQLWVTQPSMRSLLSRNR